MKQHCRETLARAYLFLDGELLSQEERVEIQEHLEECAPCYERLGIEKEVTMLVARLRGSERCPDRLRSRITSLFEA
ncbi:MAG: mycothiol system anti-sigma-R factor [Actinomycetota bacterium]